MKDGCLACSVHTAAVLPVYKLSGLLNVRTGSRHAHRREDHELTLHVSI